MIGGSAVSPETVRFLLSMDMKMLELTSQTEMSCMPQLTNTNLPGQFRIGRVGREFPDNSEVKLASVDPATGAGELLSRSRAVCMGYLNNEEKTLETIDDEGWLHSGDLLTVDSEGFYKIVGRIKELIITAGGENVAPTNIEDEIRTSLGEVVSQAVVCGEARPFLTCLLTLRVTMDMTTLAPTQQLQPRALAWLRVVCGEAEVPATVTELLESEHWPRVEAAIEAGIEAANQRAVSNVARVRRWTVLSQEFSIHGGELSPTLKLKRFHITEMYKDVINKMYE